MRKNLTLVLFTFCSVIFHLRSKAQITQLQDYQNLSSASIGTFQGINFREAGFSTLFPIQGTNGKEFWTCSDRGVNVDCANANTASCRPTYDKLYAFPSYVPKIHRIRISGNSVQILQTITIKRPNGTGASGIINPTGLGSTATEVASTDTVQDCANFNLKTTPKDTFGIDPEGLVVDKNGNFWLCEEGGATIWKLNSNGVLIQRYSPYANLAGAQAVDTQIDSVFKYRKNNRGFEGIALAPNGKIYAIIQSPILYPTTAVGEASRIHRILEIDPATNTQRMIAYLNDGIIGASGANQIRLRDWKIGDMAAINDSTFLVLEAAARGTSDIKRLYMININQATAVHSGLYGTNTLEGLVDSTGLAGYGIKAVKKTLVMDLLANSWPASLDKAEGLAIINDSTIAIANDNDFGQTSPAQDGVATATSNVSHVITYGLSGTNKLVNYKAPSATTLSLGVTGDNSSQAPYVLPLAAGVKLTSILSVPDSATSGYKMAGIPDGLGAFDNGNGTFTLLMNHEIGNTLGAVRAHGSIGSFVSKWVINKSNLSVLSGSDLIQNVNLYDTTTQTYVTYNSSNPSSKAAFGRFCSADLPPVSAFYNAATGKGTQERIFMNGEETNDESRAMAHVVTGANGGTSWELPALGKGAWENAVACPNTGDKTAVVLMNDGTDGQVYVYIGTKTNTGTEVDKAGLTNGTPWGIKVTGFPAERTSTTSNIAIPTPGTRFSLVDMGNVKQMSGVAFNTASNTAGVTKFSRPEDGAWDPSNPRDFYFNTTDQIDQVNDGVGTQVGRSRVWRLRFDSLSNLSLGGTIEAVLDGTEGQNMLDNMAIDKYGHILLQEDVGNSAHNGKIYQYTIATDQLKVLTKHDPSRFGDIGVAATAPYNQDEETSGIIDMEDILGKGMFLTSDQAHYAISGAAVEGGQLLAMFNPDTYNSSIGNGLSSSQTPYVLPMATGVKLTSVLSVPDSIAGGYKMAGIPDGLGAFDNGNGTFTLLMNHEIGNTLGAVRAHGSIGSFVSKWVINKSNLLVLSGSDLIQNVNLYDTTTQTYVTYNSSNPSSKAAFGRFCSADLPPVSAFYNAATGKGTQERIFMNGEETNDESRAMAHVVTGANGGTSWELPALGKGAWENAVACPNTGDKTAVVLMNDGTDGQVYVYIGTKTNTGTEVDKAGLTNGTPWGIKVTGFPAERTSTTSNIAIPTPGTRFSLVDMGNVKQMSGVAFNTASNTAGVTKFSRPEDGAWDPSNPRDFYFNTTDQIDQVNDGVGTQVGRSRVWRLRFDSLSNLSLGGTIEAVLDGTEGQNMLDNMAIDKYGHILLQEDVGNSAHNGKIYQYTIATDQLKVLTKHDPSRFGDIGVAATAPYNQDEETSGIIDMEDILGKGMFLTSDQAHYAISGAAVEGGQLLSMFNPDTYNAKPIISIAAARALTTTTDTVRVRGVVTRAWGRFIYIQDGTGAIGVRQASGAMVDSITSGGLKEGDSVEVFGGKGEFNNYAQLQLFNGAYTENSRVNKIASNVTVPAPVVLTLKQINTNGEQYESKVVRVVGLRTNSTATTFAASSNTTVWDGPNTGDTTTLRVIAAQDTEVEDAPAVPVYKGVFIFEGILAQFCSSPTNGCTSGYQLYGVRKKDIMESPLSAFSLLSPANNTRINTDSANTSATQINWNSSVNATKYKWFLTSATGSFNTPLAVLNANNTGADTMLSLTSGSLDAMLANLSVNKGDSIKTKWTVFAYKGLSDSLQATQVFNITLARNKAVLGAFNLSAPANNARLVVEEASTTALNINWTKSTNAVTYKWFLTTATGSFATPLARLNSNNSGTDSVLTITSGAIDNVLNSLNIKRTDSTVLKWTVYAYLTANDSLKASQDFTVNIIRNRVLGVFNLTAPVNNARVEVQENNTTPVVITWSASAKATKYIWKAALQTGSFTTPLLNRNADNGGADTKLTLTSGAIDAILATNSIKRGDSITLKWTVYAYETTDSLKAVETFNVTLVRKRILGSFSLTAPANNARVEVEQNNTTPIVITWSASANASKYKWKAATLTGNFANPLLNIDADNAGADTKLTLTSNAIDAILANNGIAKGDSLNLKWTVYAYETTDSLQATETFNVKLVRVKNVGIPTISSVENINVYPNPSNADATLAIQLQATEHTIVSLVDLQGKAVVNVLESDLIAGQHNVNLQTANLQNGVYFVRVTTGNKTTTIKLVVMH